MYLFVEEGLLARTVNDRPFPNVIVALANNGVPITYCVDPGATG